MFPKVTVRSFTSIPQIVTGAITLPAMKKEMCYQGSNYNVSSRTLGELFAQIVRMVQVRLFAFAYTVKVVRTVGALVSLLNFTKTIL